LICKEGKGKNSIIPPISHHSETHSGQSSILPHGPSTIVRSNGIAGIDGVKIYPSRIIEARRSPIAQGDDASGSVKISVAKIEIIDMTPPDLPIGPRRSRRSSMKFNGVL
jgi:hypothetical protein